MGRSDGKATELWPGPEDQGFYVRLKRELEALRSQTEERFQVVFAVLDKLVSNDQDTIKKIGFIENQFITLLF